ncbi:MAG: prepilin-type N-terminal cleavage/methylation domain-containing protein [Proteobacteria bacterium]|nr:prepilin-type N-terminal cleavage/methylation domain-containing protein [Pseudomonadota bacterium]MDA0928140.1 prepilin-type N-terminal cleavage/methylation domain-containing protein [Pseudomonadota bacterium]
MSCMRTIQRGFTLFEVMLSLALTAMLLGLLSTGIFIVAEDWNRNSDVLDKDLDEALALLQIDRALHGAFPHSFTNRETLSRQIFFVGEDDYLSWVSTVSPQRTPGLTAWELFSVEDEGVYLSLAPAYSDNPAQRLEDSKASLILPGYAVEFSYLYQELDEALQWAESWDGAESLSLPMAVYVRFTAFEDAESSLEVLARVRNNIHRSIRPNLEVQGDI